GSDQAVRARWTERALAVEDRRRRGDLGRIALVFAELAGRYAAWKDCLEDFDMTESQVVNSWVQEARDQARLEEAREILLRILRKRFPGGLTPDVLETINAQPSLEMLHDWLDTALAAFSPEAFLAVLRRC